MLTAIAIAVAFFAALLALLVAGYRQRSAPHADAGPGHEHTSAPGGTECLLCHATLPHLATADEAVSEIERTIAADRRDAAALAAVHRDRCGA